MKDKFLNFVRGNPLLFSALLAAGLATVAFVVAEAVNKIGVLLSKPKTPVGQDASNFLMAVVIVTVIVFCGVQLLIWNGRL